jgi:hypothetical protein
MGATGQLQHRVVGKEAHHRIQIMSVEGGNQALERLDVALPVPVIVSPSIAG